MTPFMLRLLDAELPLYCREADIALDRLFLLKESCEKVRSDITISSCWGYHICLFVAVVVAW